MTQFNPPIEIRETEELIAMAHGSTDEWQQEAINQAKAELIKRNISLVDQQEVLKRWAEEELQIEIEYQKQLKRNETEGYSTIEKFKIFLSSMFIVSGRWHFDLSLSQLTKENYKKKHKQRFLLLISGILFYIACGLGAYTISMNQWQKEVDNTDISKWQKNHVSKDSLENRKVNVVDSVKRN